MYCLIFKIGPVGEGGSDLFVCIAMNYKGWVQIYCLIFKMGPVGEGGSDLFVFIALIYMKVGYKFIVCFLK